VTGLAGRVAGLLSGRAQDAAYAGGWAVVRALPEATAARLFQAGADLAVRRGGPAVDRLRTNLARVAPDADLDGLVRDGMRSYARYWCEVFRLPVTPSSTVVDRMHMDDDARLRAAIASGRGVVMALPHAGNWDHAGAWATATGIRFTTVAERLKPERLFDRFLAFREGLGMEVLPLTGGARPPYEVLAERLRSGGTLCLLADRDLTPRGVPVEFFGAATRMPAGPARLALETGAALLPVSLWFRDGGWCGRIWPEVPASDVATMTQAVADAFAAGIAAHPADWHMLQRLWLDDLAPDDPRRAP
jgi:phosphatidylinositol dimannoside acyltransferase